MIMGSILIKEGKKKEWKKTKQIKEISEQNEKGQWSELLIIAGHSELQIWTEAALMLKKKTIFEFLAHQSAWNSL